MMIIKLFKVYKRLTSTFEYVVEVVEIVVARVVGVIRSDSGIVSEIDIES